MSVAAAVRTTTKAPSSQISGLLLQRQCACGGAAGLTGECEACQHKKLLGKPLQAKLSIGSPSDEYEQEADRVAEQVMRMPESNLDKKQNTSMSSPMVQRRTRGGGSGLAEAPPIVEDVLASPGQPLDAATRAFFEPRFGHNFGAVQVHADAKAAESAHEVGALAYTVGSHIIFAPGQFASETADGYRLLAHELAHVVQQTMTSRPAGIASDSGNDRGAVPLSLQRKANEEELAKKPAAEIMHDQDYIDNNMKSIEFYQAELAIIHYADGSKLRLGLVPEWIASPIEGVDYATLGSEHLEVATEKPAAFTFIPRGTQIQAPPMVTYKEFLALTTQTVHFRVEPNSGKIVPTEVNSLTAPRLCAVLREAEAQYVKAFDAMAEGAVQTLEKLGLIVTLASFLTAGGALGGATREAGKRGAAGAAAGRAGTSAASVAAAAETQLTSKFASLLKTGAAETMTVEGVTFTNVRVVLKGGEFMVRRLGIQNISGVAGRGRLVHAAYEQAAIAAARGAGASSARVALETVVNQSWRTYLVKLGYVPHIIEKVGTKGFEVLLAKVFTI